MQADIQDSAKDHFRAKDWNGGVKSMAERSADLIANSSTLGTVLLTLLGVGRRCDCLAHLVCGGNLMKYMIARRTLLGLVYGFTKRSRAALVPDINTHGALILCGVDGSTVSTQRSAGCGMSCPNMVSGGKSGATRRNVNDLKGTVGSIAVFETIVSHARSCSQRHRTGLLYWDNECSQSWKDIPGPRCICAGEPGVEE